MRAILRSWLFRFLFQALWLFTVGAADVRVAITTPVEMQVVQRTTREMGVLDVSGTVVAPAGCVVEASVVGEGVGERWVALSDLKEGQGSYRGVISVPSGGWYRLRVRVRRDAEILTEGQVAKVGVGEVFVVAGQSNSANHGEERLKVKTGRVTAFNGRGWQVADDPQPGASGGGGSFVPAFADAMTERFGVPVGLVAVGSGGTSVREWLPAGSRFTNPPTVLGNVVKMESGEWESRGGLHANLVARLKGLGAPGFRAVLWHQGESDANQADRSRTLVGGLYTRYLGDVIRSARDAAGWEMPWFVAQVSYHTPDDPGSEDIRLAQAALWREGVALEGPDTDALTGPMRDGGGKGVHFSGDGQRAHGRLWAEKVGAWLEGRLAGAAVVPGASGPGPGLTLPGMERLTVGGRPAFLYLPEESKRTNRQPWVLYGPTLPGLPDSAERWMHERFLAAGVAVVGVDVGEAYGSPRSHAAFDGLYAELIRRGFAARGCLLGRSRGGLLVTGWGTLRVDRVSGVAGIYPVFDYRSYPGVTNAASAYGVSPGELLARAGRWSPVSRAGELAKAGVPAFLIHGDVDTVVPLPANSGEFVRQYEQAGASSRVKLVVLPGQGHNMYEGFFRSQELVDFVIDRARAGRE